MDTGKRGVLLVRIGVACAVAVAILMGASAIAPVQAVGWKPPDAASRGIRGAERHEVRRDTPVDTVSQTAIPDGNTQDGWVLRPTCDTDCQFYDIFGNVYERGAGGSVATPIGTTYSAHHLVGADIDADGRTDCALIAELPPPGAPDDIVTFDAIPEQIRTDVRGTVPTVTESKVDNTNGTHALVIDTSSPQGTDLFPGGLTDSGTGMPLTDACFFIGLDDQLDWEGVNEVLSASLSLTRDGVVQVGPLDVTDFFVNPWNGLFGTSVADLAGFGINGVHVEMLVSKTRPELVGACCVDGVCTGDVEEISCEFQGGRWNPGASCGIDPDLPAPRCDQPTCSYLNGSPLEDRGGPTSQVAPEEPFVAGAADDFILTLSGGNACRTHTVRAWMTNVDGLGSIDPRVAYEAINVTIYANEDPKGPAGRPEDDGSHTPSFHGGIVYTQTIPMSDVTATQLIPGPCLMTGFWELEIPVGITLQKDTKYWLEIQPIMTMEGLGQAIWALSESSNGHTAQRITPAAGITDWRAIAGNEDVCPAGDPPTPPAGTRTDLAFELVGQAITTPPNNNCEDASLIGEGAVSFSTEGASTDGADEPEMCEFFQYTHLENDIWFEHTATCSGELTVSLCGSDFDTKLAVYETCGFCPPRGLPVACNEDRMDLCGLQSEVTLDVVEGECYRIRVAGYLGETGPGILTVRCTEPPPPTGACCGNGVCIGTMFEADCVAQNGEWFEGENCPTFACPRPPPPHDECADCIPVLTEVQYNGSTVGASGEDISSCEDNDTADVWHCWTADCTGTARVSLCDSAYDTSLAVFDVCGGRELACSDDDCATRSQVDVFVEEGTTYYLRVSGYQGRTGDYAIIVRPCRNACCLLSGICGLATRELCLIRDGSPLGEGSVCLGDLDGDGVDDACQLCGDATMVDAQPPDGTVDARQPHEHSTVLPRQGIGSPGAVGSAREPIVITLDPPVSVTGNCFALCETATDPSLGPNAIAGVTEVTSGVYEIVLDHAITAGAVTTIEYLGDDSYVTYTSHPANVNGDNISSSVDIPDMINVLDGMMTSPWGMYSEDIDRSGVLNPADILRVIDLLNGADEFDTWNDTPIPVNASCP